MSEKTVEEFREFDSELGLIESFTGYRNDEGEIVKHGPFRRITRTGVVIEDGQLRDGLRHGMWREYYENGKLSSAGKYEAGKPDGVHQSWFENGRIQSERTFDDGCLHGRQRHYWDSGRLREESNYKHDEKNGECRSWGEDGRLLAAGIFRNDMPWQGTFLSQSPMEGEDQFANFNDYVDRYLNRGFIVAELSNGKFVRVVEDHRNPLSPREPQIGKSVESQEHSLHEAIHEIATLGASDPEVAWTFLTAITDYPDEDTQELVANELIDPILKNHFDAFVDRVDRQVQWQEDFARALIRCSEFENTTDPKKGAHFDWLREEIDRRYPQ